MKRTLILIPLLALAVPALAQDPAAPRELRVGPGEAFEKPSDAARAARDGDTVRIAAGTWRGDVCVWPQNELSILGAGADATILDAEGRAAAGKGLWVVRGTNVAIRGVTLRGAACPDRNGAGIRHEADGALAVSDCRFEDNENGFLSGVATNAVLTFERCAFRGNGAGDGQSHNLYAGRAKRLVFRDCASDHAREGHALKSRALATVVERCVFDDGDDGRSSYLVDCPDGGLVDIARCRFVQSPVAPNGTMVSIGEESVLPGSSLFLGSDNEFENRRASGTEVRSLVPARKMSQPGGPGPHRAALDSRRGEYRHRVARKRAPTGWRPRHGAKKFRGAVKTARGRSMAE